jgi:hypothetical protein
LTNSGFISWILHVSLPSWSPHSAASYEAACAFADFSNWLIPGRVMLGRYPFVEPSRCRSRDVGEEQLRRLLAAGVTTFVCLQVLPACLPASRFLPAALTAIWHLNPTCKRCPQH